MQTSLVEFPEMIHTNKIKYKYNNFTPYLASADIKAFTAIHRLQLRPILGDQNHRPRGD